MVSGFDKTCPGLSNRVIGRGRGFHPQDYPSQVSVAQVSTPSALIARIATKTYAKVCWRGELLCRSLTRLSRGRPADMGKKTLPSGYLHPNWNSMRLLPTIISRSSTLLMALLTTLTSFPCSVFLSPLPSMVSLSSESSTHRSSANFLHHAVAKARG